MRSQTSCVALFSLTVLAACGGGGGGGDGGGKPPAADVVPPSTPTRLTATPTGLRQAELTWQPATDAGTGVAGYRVFRDGVEIASVSATSYMDSGLAPSTGYTFTVSAYDSATPANVSTQSAPARVKQPPEFSVEVVPIKDCNRIETYARQLNESGWVLGRDFLYHDGAVTDLMPGEFRSIAMNNSGDVVGWVLVAYPPTDPKADAGVSEHSFLYRAGVMRDIGTLGGYWTLVYGMNEPGQVCGASELPRPEAQADRTYHAFVYSNGEMKDLGTLGGKYSGAADMNAAGEVVGGAYTADGEEHAFLYRDGVMTDLGTLGGRTSYARGISGSGHVYGYYEVGDASSTERAFWYSNGKMFDVGTLGGSGTYVEGMASDGRLYGYSDLPGDTAHHAFLFSDGVMTDLGTLGGVHSAAAGMNAAGQIFGNSDVLDAGGQRGFLYRDGKMTDLGSLDADYSWATDMNESGQVVGGTSSGRAFLYIDGKMWDVEKLIDPTSTQKIPECDKVAIAVNDAGQILVRSLVCPFHGGYLDRYCYRSLLTPRPTPAANR